MSIAENLICCLKIAGMVSGGYVGYCYGSKVKQWSCKRFPLLKKYNDTYIVDSFKDSQLSEDTTFNMIGSLTGVLGGFYAWPVAIPMMVYRVSEDYPEEIEKIKKFIKD